MRLKNENCSNGRLFCKKGYGCKCRPFDLD
jgi:hypothetical protein